MQIDQILEVLDGVERRHGYYMARCPAHSDTRASLSVTERDGKILWNCKTGCSQEDVTEAIKSLLPESDKSDKEEPEAVYDYVDEEGKLLFQALRYEGKKFRQRRSPDDWSLNGVRRVPYRLPEVLLAVAQGRTVYIVEGEKDADRLRSEGRTATCNPMGAGKWRPEFNDHFKGAKVIIVADKDQPGYAHAESVRRNLEGVAADVWVVQAREGKDTSDHLDLGYSVEQLEVVERQRHYRPLDLFVPAPPVDWIVEGVVVGGEATLLVADGGSGKSYFALAMSLCVVAGAPFLGRTTTQGRVIYVDEEGSPDLALQRLAELGASETQKRYLDYLNFAGVDLVNHPERLLEDALIVKPRLIVIDSHAETTKQADENSNAEMGRVWRSMKDIARETKSAMLVIHHTNMFGSSRGASQIRNSADQVLKMQRNHDGSLTVFGDKQRRVVLPVKFRFQDRPGGGYEIVAA